MTIVNENMYTRYTGSKFKVKDMDVFKNRIGESFNSIFSISEDENINIREDAEIENLEAIINIVEDNITKNSVLKGKEIAVHDDSNEVTVILFRVNNYQSIILNAANVIYKEMNLLIAKDTNQRINKIKGMLLDKEIEVGGTSNNYELTDVSILIDHIECLTKLYGHIYSDSSKDLFCSVCNKRISSFIKDQSLD